MTFMSTSGEEKQEILNQHLALWLTVPCMIALRAQRSHRPEYRIMLEEARRMELAARISTLVMLRVNPVISSTHRSLWRLASNRSGVGNSPYV